MIALDIRGLVKRYCAGIRGCAAGVDALRGVDLRVRAREVVGIAGAPGAGKSTLLLCAAGILRIDAGTIAWFGGACSRPSRPAGIAYVPDRAVHYAFLSVREVLEHQCNLSAVAERDRPARVRDALQRCALDGLADGRVGRLPPAARPRLALAQALVGAPRLVLVDEPFADLDDDGRDALVDVLQGLGGDGVTMVVASRDNAALARVAPRLVVLSLGQVHRELDPARLDRTARVAERAH